MGPQVVVPVPSLDCSRRTRGSCPRRGRPGGLLGARQPPTAAVVLSAAVSPGLPEARVPSLEAQAGLRAAFDGQLCLALEADRDIGGAQDAVPVLVAVE